MKNLIKRLIPEQILKKYRALRERQIADAAAKRGRASWSQEGEDLVLAQFLEGKRNGYYVDVGAHDPFRFSNTHFFYRLGWKGINIDPLPGTIEKFKKARPLDISLEMGVSNLSGKLRYFMFNEPALNSFDESLSRSRDPRFYRLLEEREVEVKPLSEILEKHLPSGTTIDLLNVDVEGLDLEVLSSNDFERFRPRFLIVECLEASLTEIQSYPTISFLRTQDYIPVGKTRFAIILKDLRN